MPLEGIRVRAGSEDQLADTVLTGEHLAVPGAAACRHAAGIDVGEGHGSHAVLARLSQHALPTRAGRQRDDLELLRGSDDPPAPRVPIEPVLPRIASFFI